jgi:hypothetical protein
VPDWIPDWITVIGLPLALLGLYLGRLQLQTAQDELEKVADAATAAQQASESAERKLNANQLLIRAPRLSQLERDVSAAVDADDRAGARQSLEAWRLETIAFREILEARDELHSDLAKRFIETLLLVTTAEQDLEEDFSIAVADATKHARRVMRGLGAEMAAIAQRIASNLEGGT